jgi:microcystin-dependent protein
MTISQNTALFSLLGTYFGGNGVSNFALPDLQGAAPMHWGQGPGLSDHFLGDSGGVPAVALLEQEVPPHAHSFQASAHNAKLNNPSPSNSLARSTPG